MLNETPRAYGGPVVPSGTKARADLLQQADQILKDADGKAPPTEPSWFKDAKGERLRSWEQLVEDGLESVAATDYERRPSREGKRAEPVAPWAGPEILAVDEESEVAELLERFGLTKSEHKLVAVLLDGRPIPVDGSEFLPAVADVLDISHANARQTWSRAKRKIRDSAAGAEMLEDWELIRDMRRIVTASGR
jgi:hypothetical protein